MSNRDVHSSRPTALAFAIATEADVAEIAALRNAAADDLTRTHGKGHWSGQCSERGVLSGVRTSRVILARAGRGKASRLVGALRLATKKPWAIDRSHFIEVPRTLYLLDMAIEPSMQRRGIGRRLLKEAVGVAKAWPAQSIRLDAYDAGRWGDGAGAGGFYAKCGFREVGRVTYRGVPLAYFEMML